MKKKRKKAAPPIKPAGPLVKDPRLQKVLAFGVTNYRRIAKGLEHAARYQEKGEGEKVLAKRRAKIAAGKLQATGC